MKKTVRNSLNLLDPRRIENWKNYLKIDREASEIFLNVLQAEGFRPNPARAGLQREFQILARFAWRVEDKFFTDMVNFADQPVNGCEIFHQAMHTLIAKRFVAKRRGFPQLCMFNEALGVAIDVYCTLRGIQEGLPLNMFGLASFAKNAERQGLLASTLVNETVDDPYLAFRAVALENFALFKMIHAELGNKTSGTSINRKINRFVKKHPFSVFYMHFSLVNVAIYASAHCGYRSSSADQAAVAECMAILKKSETFAGFLRELSRGVRFGNASGSGRNAA